MGKVVIFAVILSMTFAAPNLVRASPANPGFFERLLELAGDILTFGDLAKARRNLSKAEDVFDDLDKNKDAAGEIQKSGLERYRNRLTLARDYFNKAQSHGSKAASFAWRIVGVTDNHIEKLDDFAQIDEFPELARAIEAAKEINKSARDILGITFKDEKGESEELVGLTTASSTDAKVESAGNKSRVDRIKPPIAESGTPIKPPLVSPSVMPTPPPPFSAPPPASPSPAPALPPPPPPPTPLVTPAAPEISAELKPLQGLWNLDKVLEATDTTGNKFNDVSAAVKKLYFSVKGDKICRAAQDPYWGYYFCSNDYSSFSVKSGEIFAPSIAGSGAFADKMYFQSGLIEHHKVNQLNIITKYIYKNATTSPVD